MSAYQRLSESDRSFFAGVAASAFENPFGEGREDADRRAAGAAAGTDFDTVLRQLLDTLGRRLEAIAPGGAVDCRSYAGEDREWLTVGVLFQTFHRFIGAFDELIRQQLAAGEASCPAPFAADVCDALTRHGLTREEAGQYVAVFYQLRRAFYFISTGLVGTTPSMRQLRERLWNNIFTCNSRRYLRFLWDRMEDFSTLLLGETGTGKGAAAFALGSSGFIPFDPARGCFAESFTRAFVAINLSQYPESLIESELFGHRKGAFTGAVERHDGVFSRCSPHGAIFLDEIGDVSEPVQIKLLQVLQQRTFSPVGSHELRRFSGRVIAATHRPLDDLRRAGRFRDDFYYRLCSDQIALPTLACRLSESPAELDLLVGHILGRLCGGASAGVLPDVLASLRRTLPADYAWPGNVRELEQAVRCVLLTGAYRGDPRAVAGDGDMASVLERGECTVKELTALYCKRLFARCGSYGEVARRTGLDWRTVKKYTEA